MTFRCASELKKLLLVVWNTTGQIRAKCIKPNCPWLIYASNDTITKYFMVKTYVDEHNCQVSFKNKKVTAKWLATNYLYKCIGAI